ncbi:hypothetical protein Ciccas_003758 [Cichlidogyrus casuarinus]|uniref:Uncharacterized protein n=1 Tax=Cichlidogyrus casuarinus TaxID=1844966 RepID=A0ABD2QDN0_9PLAT
MITCSSVAALPSTGMSHDFLHLFLTRDSSSLCKYFPRATQSDDLASVTTAGSSPNSIGGNLIINFSGASSPESSKCGSGSNPSGFSAMISSFANRVSGSQGLINQLQVR